MGGHYVPLGLLFFGLMVGVAFSLPPRTLPQRETKLAFLHQKFLKAIKGSPEMHIAKKHLEDEISLRDGADASIKKIVDALVAPEHVKTILFESQRSGNAMVDYSHRYKNMMEIYLAHCGQSVYSLRHSRVIANLCNLGIGIEQFKSVVLEVCKGENR